MREQREDKRILLKTKRMPRAAIWFVLKRRR